MRVLRDFGWAAALTVVALVGALVFGGVTTALVVLLLGVLEISLSFDNAVVNAKVLQRMHPVWQRLFLTVGILVAVFGMRLLLPVLIVSITSHLGLGRVVDLALHDSRAYGDALAQSEVAVYAFGGTFLLMIFLDFVLDPEREILWLRPLEKALQAIGKLDQLSVLVALGGIYLMSRIAHDGRSTTVLLAGLAGLAAYLAVNGLDALFEDGMDDADDPSPGASSTRMSASVFRAGIFTFVYLEVLDASFSFDGVIGAFAISDQVLTIALGLGIGAFWIRSLTLYLVKAGTLSEYVYLEHGAHWAIGVLAAIMLVSVRYAVNEVVTGLVGVAFIGLALVSSVRERGRQGVQAQDVLGSAPR